MKILLGFFLSLLCMIFCISPVAATVVIPSTLDYMTNESDLIVIGYVREYSSYWENKNIYTNVVVEVDSVVKSAAETVSGNIMVRVLGGKVGDITQSVNSAPNFEVDDKVMLFLKKWKSYYTTYGFNYGKYEIRYDQGQDKEFIDGPLFHHEVRYNLKTMEPMLILEPPGRRELAPFLEEVKRLVPEKRR